MPNPIKQQGNVGTAKMVTPTSGASLRPANGKTGGVLSRLGTGWSDREALKMLLYGRSATGKTTLWSTFPGPILCLICSGGSEPGELKSIDTAEMRRKVVPVALNSTAEVREVVEHAKVTGEYRTVVLDHASGLQDMTLREILGLETLPVQKSWGLASQQQYGQSSAMCKELMRSLLNLKTNVVIVAQERSFGSEQGAESELVAPTVGAALSPSVTGWLNPACDYVVQTFIRPKMVESEVKIGNNVMKQLKRGKGVEYCLRTEPHDVYITKFRVPKGHTLPDVIVNPTYDKILAVIHGQPLPG